MPEKCKAKENSKCLGRAIRGKYTQWLEQCCKWSLEEHLPQALLLMCLPVHCVIKTVEELFYSHLFERGVLVCALV